MHHFLRHLGDIVQCALDNGPVGHPNEEKNVALSEDA
jgi:hypothetical protein